MNYETFNAICTALEGVVDGETYIALKDIAYQCLCMENDHSDDELEDLITMIKDNLPSSKFKSIEPQLISLYERSLSFADGITLEGIGNRWKQRIYIYADAIYLLLKGYVPMSVVTAEIDFTPDTDPQDALRVIDAHIHYRKDQALKKHLMYIVVDHYCSRQFGHTMLK